MDTLNKIMCLLQEHNKTQKELTDYIGIEKSVFSDWKKGKSKSYKKYIAEIAEFFGVSADYLLGFTDDPIDYENTDEVINARAEVYDQLGGDAKKIHGFYAAVDEDAAGEYYDEERGDYLHYFGVDYGEESIIRKYRKLDEEGTKAVKKVLYEEYARCTQKPQETQKAKESLLEQGTQLMRAIKDAQELREVYKAKMNRAAQTLKNVEARMEREVSAGKFLPGSRNHVIFTGREITPSSIIIRDQDLGIIDNGSQDSYGEIKQQISPSDDENHESDTVFVRNKNKTSK